MLATCRSFVMSCFVLLARCLNSALSDSYHLMIGGFILFEFCLFMISISKPEQYYQVIGLYHLHSCAVSFDTSEVIVGSRTWDGYSNRNHVYSSAWSRITLFPKTTCTSYRGRYIRRCLTSDVPLLQLKG